jgi:hypothetical protein
LTNPNRSFPSNSGMIPKVVKAKSRFFPKHGTYPVV